MRKIAVTRQTLWPGKGNWRDSSLTSYNGWVFSKIAIEELKSFQHLLERVAPNSKLTEPFDIQYWIRQGCPLTCSVYVLAITVLDKKQIAKWYHLELANLFLILLVASLGCIHNAMPKFCNHHSQSKAKPNTTSSSLPTNIICGGGNINTFFAPCTQPSSRIPTKLGKHGLENEFPYASKQGH